MRENTFLSWLIANLEVVFIFFTILIQLIIFLAGQKNGWFVGFSDPQQEFSEECVAWLFSLIIAVVISVFIVSGIKDVKGFIVTLVVLSVVILLANFANDNEIIRSINDLKVGLKEDFGISLNWLVWLCIPSLIVGIFTAIYAYQNFDDVVSRRFLYRNSAASVFEYEWKYTINRFLAGFIAFYGLALQVFVFVTLFRIAGSL